MADFLSSIFGAKPQIADYTPVDLTQEQLDQLQADISQFPEIEQLGNLYQTYLLGAYDKAIPGFTDILKMGGSTTQQMLSDAESELAGKIPQDVMDQVYRSGAFQGLMSGGGPAFTRSLQARDLGLTSLDLINQGANLAGAAGNAAQRWASLSGAQLPGFLQDAFISPWQRAQFEMEQNLIKRNIQQQKFNVAAAPDPALQALNQWVEQVGGTILGAYATGGMSKGGDYKTSYNPSSYGASDVYTPGTALNYNPQTGQMFDQSSGSPGYAPPNSYLPTGDIGSTEPFQPSFQYDPNAFTGGTNLWSAFGSQFGGRGMDWGFNPYGG